MEAAREPAGDDAGGGSSALWQELGHLSADERTGRVLELVLTQVAVVLRHQAADAVEAGRPFKELGFDSIAAVELRNRLRAATGLRLPATPVFDYPTRSSLAGHLLTQVLAEQPTTNPALGHLDALEAALAALPPDDSGASA